MTLAVSC